LGKRKKTWVVFGEQTGKTTEEKEEALSYGKGATSGEDQIAQAQLCFSHCRGCGQQGIAWGRDAVQMTGLVAGWISSIR